ncbi:MAG: glutamine-hydrolyzing carbamoyl-phosphate synthase small subunit [Deltaproteobacteria bacterium]|nr:glutamine-hydrolyzing carbamoyl-phosphate synthase small subunit [Deltaproteobacteria bacterium]MBI2501131.1 glutamine-hydrolyzing carbamoyl-phosphate synthase small subunit [Deltaproteobacteria bacterium]
MGKFRSLLVLEDGLVFEGRSFGHAGEAIGEIVFNTSMTGYQEILTDPSYKGQIVVMTYPEIGNYGVNTEDVESSHPFVEGFVVRHYNPVPSNFRAREELGSYLKKNKILAIEGIDTRKLTRHLRDYGSKMGIISTKELNTKKLLREVRLAPKMVGRDLVKEVTCKRPYRWTKGVWSLSPRLRGGEGGIHVIAYDFGIKQNILRNLVDAGCHVTVVPASTPAEEVLKKRPDGVFLSNGPGDPEPVTYAVKTIRSLLGKVPLFGICLGHQLLGLALGGKTYKLKFGHHGGNQPVMDLTTRKVEITAQNHGFAVDTDSLKGKAELTHINLNDKTVEGMRLTDLPVFSVQYHPEASPGPHDAHYLFERFINLMKENRI